MSAETSQYPLRPDDASGSSNPHQQHPQDAHAHAAGDSRTPQHKRVYQACIPCRRRKVKCDLGSVDDPGQPPCVRCRRESKECFFSATRRKRKAEDGGDDSLDGFEFGDDYIARNGRKMVHASPPGSIVHGSMGAPHASRSAGYADEIPQPGPPLTPGGSIGRAQPLRRPQQGSDTSQRADRSSDEQLENLEAQEVMRREVYGPHDALDLLYKAATDNPVQNRHGRNSSSQMSPMIGDTNGLDQTQPSPLRSSALPQHGLPPISRRNPAIDPALEVSVPDRMQEQGYKDAINAWSRFRFVRAGWFTPAEAIDYIEYYYEYLSPLTPISPPTFRYPGTHPTLLTEEPILTVTLLTMASRYRKIPGPGGHCRSHTIHEQLWTYLRGMIERCLWGQEAFGGGFCGSGAETTGDAQTSSTAPWRGLRKGSLRTLGTIESLMILTEWHPRALHFPPAEATDELMLPLYNTADTTSNGEDDGNRLPGGVGGKRIESWLEPAWRSDRMCWMLLSNAMGLSYELGVFDNIDELLAAGGEMTRPEYEDEAYRLRAARIKRLLLIYVTQLAGRLGWTNMASENLRVTDPAFAPRKRRASIDGKTPETNSTISNIFNYIPDLELDDQIIHCWAGISNAMRIGNEKFFKSRQYTTRIIQDGTYIELLRDFQPMLRTWKAEFERFRLPQHIRHILWIEYEYVRIYVNSLSLQAVVERCTNNAGNAVATNAGNGPAAVPPPLSPETQNYFGKLPLARLGGFGPADQGYVKEVVDGSRNLLRTVVEGLLPGDYLKHAPVRTYFRIVSGAMFLLKTFALGASKYDVGISIGLMDAAVDALRNCVVDDVHLGIRFADLLDTLTSRLRSRFISAPTGPPPPGDVTGGVQSPPGRNNQPPSSKRAKMEQGDQIRDWNAGNPSSNINSIDPNVSATPYDLNQGSFFPGTPYSQAPGSTYGGDTTDTAFGADSDWNNGSEMWYLPPGAAFFQNVNDQAITQTADGVNVGGMDLLDYMTLGDFPSMDGPGF